jgi:hypothetical protein
MSQTLPDTRLDPRGLAPVSRHLVLALAVSVLFTACGQDAEEPPPRIFKPQREALEKAKGVEQTLQQSADRRREQIEREEK